MRRDAHSGHAMALARRAACFAAVGCGDPSDSTPVACLEGTGAYLKALGDAPGAVKLRGETLISDCLAENQQGGDLATVGTAMVDGGDPAQRRGAVPNRVATPTCSSATCSAPPNAAPRTPTASTRT